MDTREITRRTGATRGQLSQWRRAGVLRPHFRVGDRLLTSAEVDVRYPSGLPFPEWDDADVERASSLLHLIRYGFNVRGAGQLLDELAERPGAPVLLAPGITARASACTCPEDCNPFRADVLAAQRDLRPEVVLPADARPVVAL